MGAQKLDHNEHPQFICGAFGQAHLNCKTQNDAIKHTLDLIHLCPDPNAGGGHEVLNSNTSKAVTGPCFAMLPMTNAVRDRIEELAARDGVTEIEFCNGKSVSCSLQSDWIAGVDCDQDKFGNDMQPDEDCIPKMEQDNLLKHNEEVLR